MHIEDVRPHRDAADGAWATVPPGLAAVPYFVRARDRSELIRRA
jgi:hypothetical protein